jgi:hypothetical protein
MSVREDIASKQEVSNVMTSRRIAACLFLAMSPLMLLCVVVEGSFPPEYHVAAWIESPKQNERIYYYASDNPTFNATVRLHRTDNSMGSLSLNVFFQGTLVAEVAAESDTVIRSELSSTA